MLSPSTGFNRLALDKRIDTIFASRAPAYYSRVGLGVAGTAHLSALATIGLTIPAVPMFGLAAGKPIILGLDAVDITLPALTPALSNMTFSSSRTNVLLGTVHFWCFLLICFLSFSNNFERHAAGKRYVCQRTVHFFAPEHNVYV